MADPFAPQVRLIFYGRIHYASAALL